DQPAAKSCSGLAPAPGLPGRDSLTSRRPSELRDMPTRPPVVWTFAVYSTFSSRFISPAFMKSPDARSSVARGKIAWLDRDALDSRSGIVRRSQIGKLGKEIAVGAYLVLRHLSVCDDSNKSVTDVVGERPAVAWK